MLRCHLDLWPLDLELLYKIWAKSNNPPLSYWRFSPFSMCNVRGGARTTEKRFSGVRGSNFTKPGQDIGRSLLHKKFISVFGYLAAFSNAGGWELRDIENDAKFRTFSPPPLWKLGDGWARSLYQMLKLTYDRSSEIHLMAIRCVAAERGGLINKSSATVKSTARPLCLLGVLYGIYQETTNRSTANQPLWRRWPRKATEFCEITQSNGQYAVQGHSRSPILVPIMASTPFKVIQGHQSWYQSKVHKRLSISY